MKDTPALPLLIAATTLSLSLLGLPLLPAADRADPPAPSSPQPSRPPPPGPHVRKVDPATLAKRAFGKGQPLVGTYYFYWYDASTGEHFVDGDGSDALTDHPALPEGYSYRSMAWHRRELLDILDAGCDFILPVFWGVPGSSDEWSFTGLPPLVEAARSLEAEGKTPPRIGLFYDTSTLRHNRHGFHADLTTLEGKEWLYVTARDFYSMIPHDLWACVEGQPIIWLYSAAFARRQDPAALAYLRAEFVRDFGARPFIVKETSWQGEADLTYAWGAALHLSILGVAAVGPGYDHSAVPGRRPLVRAREDGAFYSRSWELALSRAPARRPAIAVVETWNELHEGTEIAPTREHGRKYVELTRKYADLWHAGARLERPGSFAHAAEVSVTLGSPNRGEGLEQREPEDGQTAAVEVEGRPARQSVTSGKGGDYIYFAVDDSFFCGDEGPLEVELVAYDHVKGEVALDYDSTDATATLHGAFKRVIAGTLVGAGGWRTFKVRLADPAFTGRANGSDFRLSVPGGGLTLQRVVVRRIKP